MRKHNTFKQWAVIGGVLAASASVNVQAREIDWYVHAGLDFGGDEMVEVFFDDGESDEINAGELLYVAGGLIVQTAPRLNEHLETQLTIGWKFDSVDAENGDVTFSRFPLEALQFVKNGRWRFGGGLTYHLNPTLEGDGVVGDLDVEFDDALGVVAQVDFAANNHLLIGGRLTFIDYEIDDVDAESVDGNSFGIFAGARF